MTAAPTIPGVPSTLAMYGADVEAAASSVRTVAASIAEGIRDLKIDDPAGNLQFGLAQAVDIAAALGVEVDLGATGGIVGIMGSVIQAYVGRLVASMDAKRQEENKARGKAQELALASLKKAGGPWIYEGKSADLGDAAFVTGYGNVGLVGVLSKERRLVFPIDGAAGCYRKAPPAGSGGRGPAGVGGTWRLWPAFYPLSLNTTQLTFTSSTQMTLIGQSAYNLMQRMMTEPFDGAPNLLQDAQIVAETLRRFKEWSRPMIIGTSDMGKLDLEPVQDGVVSPHPRHDQGFRHLKWNTDGVTLSVHNPMIIKATATTPAREQEYMSTWVTQDPFTINVCSPNAYNHVIRTIGRFFAAREHLLAALSWSTTLRNDVAKSPDPVVQQALKRPLRPRPQGRQETSTQGGGGRPVPKANAPTPARKPRPPARAPRPGGALTLGDVLDAPNMATMVTRLATWKRGQ